MASLNVLKQILSATGSNRNEYEIRVRGVDKNFFDFQVSQIGEFDEERTYVAITYNNDVRSIEENGTTIWQIKKQAQKGFEQNCGKYLLRFGVTEENVATEADARKGTITHVRHIKRYTKNYPKWKLDLSEVFMDTTIVYEMELEFLSKPEEILVHEGFSFLSNLLGKEKFIYLDREKSNEVTRALKSFLSLQVNQSFYTIMQVPINVKKTQNLVNHAVTLKADGYRYFLFTHEKSLYLVSDVNVRKVANVSIDEQTFLLDCEVVNDDEIYAFEILFSNLGDLRSLSLFDRYESLQKAVNEINLPFLHVKKYEFDGTLKERIDAITGEGDGLIFVPFNEPYQNSNVFKFKPASHMTIDFQIINPLSQAVNVFELKTSNNENFAGSEKHPFRKSLEIFSFPKVFELQLVSGKVVEFAWRNRRFVPVRVRYDKQTGNNAFTAASVWDDIHSPVELDALISNAVAAVEKAEKVEKAAIAVDPLEAFRKHHNFVKNDLISRYCGKVSNSRVLDLGSGRGGDLFKYARIDLSKLYLTDPDPENLAELRNRLSKPNLSQLRKKTAVKEISAQSSDAIWEFIRKTPVNTITSFFMLTHIFDTPSDVESFVRTLELTSEKDTYFVGTVMDGNQVLNAMGNEEKISGEGWRIEMIQRREFGSKIKIHMDGTMVDEQVEYLVDFSYLEKKLNEIGFVKEESRIFPNFPAQQTLNSFFRLFVFKRAANTQVDLPQIMGMLRCGDIKPLRTSLVQGHSINLFRMGVPGEGSCFFHSYFTCIKNSGYADILANDQNLSPYELENAQKDFIASFRRDINNPYLAGFNERTYMNLANGSLAEIDLSDEKTYSSFFLKHSNRPTKQQDLKIARKKFQDSMQSVRKISPEFVVKSLEKAFENYGFNMQAYIDSRIEAFIAKFQNPSEWADQTLILYVCEKDRYNLVFIDVNTGKIAPGGILCKGFDVERPTIFMAYHNETHFEPIFSRKGSDSDWRYHPSSQVNKVFNNRDSFIAQVRRIICDSENLPVTTKHVQPHDDDIEEINAAIARLEAKN